MKFYRPIDLKTAEIIRIAALKQMADLWDFHSERLMRMPLHGEVFTSVNQELQDLGMPPIGMWSIFARGPGHEQAVHCDATSPTERVNSGLIVPVLGTKGSKMQWLDESGLELRNVMNPDGKSSLFKCVSFTELRVLEEVEVVEPLIATLCIPHRALASPTHPRAVVSIKLLGNPILL